MTMVEELERRIIIKRQLIEWTEEDIRDLEKKLKAEKKIQKLPGA